jgi:hypothetical protein
MRQPVSVCGENPLYPKKKLFRIPAQMQQTPESGSLFVTARIPGTRATKSFEDFPARQTNGSTA